MIIKTIIFIIIGYIIQLSALNWFSILIYAAFIGAGSNSYKQSLILGLCIGVIPWLIQFSFYYNSAIILLNRIQMMLFNFQSANSTGGENYGWNQFEGFDDFIENSNRGLIQEFIH